MFLDLSDWGGGREQGVLLPLSMSSDSFPYGWRGSVCVWFGAQPTRELRDQHWNHQLLVHLECWPWSVLPWAGGPVF